jgi:TPP-dependent pyruvate/acetoin dehydrogenase alpha subunit
MARGLGIMARNVRRDSSTGSARGGADSGRLGSGPEPGVAAAVASPPSLEVLYRRMVLIRVFEESLHELFAAGKTTGTIHTCIGQEANAVGVTAALCPDDLVVSNHRGHGHYLGKTGDVDGLMAEIMGRATGVCAGRAGSQHVCSVSGGFFANGVLGGTVPTAAGMALAEKVHASGRVVVVFIGDGALGTGVCYETFNLASLWGLPLLIVIEANGWAQSTPTRQGLAGGIPERARAFGIDAVDLEVPGVESVRELAAVAVERVRSTLRPSCLVLHAYRLGPHSKGEPEQGEEELARHRAKDPLLLDRGRLSDALVGRIDEECRERIALAIRRAEQAGPA